MIFKVAVLQMRSENRAYEENIKTIIKYMTEAKKNNADILLLPECFITAYDLTIGNDSAISESDLTALCDKAKELGIGLVATAFDGVKIGIMICYDREYPESARILMLKGAEIILVPNDCVSMRPRLQALSTRAYENMCGVAMAYPNGKNAGNSCAYSPICWDDNDECTDNTLLLANAETEGLFYAAFDMDAIRKYRELEMMGNTFRKVKAYSDLLSDEIQYPFIREGQ